MDATESDFDIKLQKISADLIADFDRSLPTFLRKPDGRGGTRIRSRVRANETFRLTSSVLDSFQELPQLLDPHLPKWIPFLSDAYLDSLQTRGRRTASSRGASSKFLMSVDQAICKILYTFCKIRGEKVIVRFLNVETKYLELLLSAIEAAEQETQGPADDASSAHQQWSWEQRYVVLLWLSHLMLAPFDLSTISSVDLTEATTQVIPGLQLPDGLPGITLRVIPLGIKYLATPGRERDAAKMLLVRVSMRRDMQKLGVLDSLVSWAQSVFRPGQEDIAETPYFYLGVLSFLAGILRASSDTSDMNRYLSTIFNVVHGISASESEPSKTIVALALARKMITKVLRSVVILSLRQSSHTEESTEMTETAIGYLLERLADNDTPVRLAASKSLSIITLKLDPEMASQVVEAVLESLNRNVLWNKMSDDPAAKLVRDLSAVDSLEWHGLMLTLSHLLYRRSPPATQLSDIIHALLIGLSFEQRSTSGSSVGSNVRDAACFGIWALARRYTTQELLAIPTESVFAAKAHTGASSILQVLGTELVVTGSLDPAGNIRRGASAALQELIGRHPDTVERGIEVVQTVDYHAVARRSRAIEEVALNATKLSSMYGAAIIDALLGWRGVGDVHAPSRRASGTAFGTLTAELARFRLEDSRVVFKRSLQLITEALFKLQKRQAEERHGLLLCLAAAMDNFPELACEAGGCDPVTAQHVLQTISHTLESHDVGTSRRPEIIAEGASALVVAMLPVLQVLFARDDAPDQFATGDQLLSQQGPRVITELARESNATSVRSEDVERFMSAVGVVIPQCLDRKEDESIVGIAQAGLVFLIFSPADRRQSILREWADAVRQKPTGRSSAHGPGYFLALTMADPLVGNNRGQAQEEPQLVAKALSDRWNADTEIETRVAILQSLTRGRLLQDKPSLFLRMLRDGLNDYTTSAQGDIGSHVRVGALRAVRSLWDDIERMRDEDVGESVDMLFCSVLRLSAEKLDRVRPEAQGALSAVMQQSHSDDFQCLTFSSRKYFDTLLQLLYATDCLEARVSSAATADPDGWMAELMAGFVTSADTGNESLVIASRASLCDFCETSQGNLNAVCASLLRNLKVYEGQDRVLVPTLEIIGFLFHVGIYQRAAGSVNLRSLCLQTQKAGYKTGNVRKIAACVKVYGGVAGMEAAEAAAAAHEARRRLGALMHHPWSRIRIVVVDEVWGLVGDVGEVHKGEGGGIGDRLMGVDWARADKASVRALVEELKLN